MIADPSKPGYSLVANSVWKRLLDFRMFIQAYKGVENCYYDEIKEFEDVDGVKRCKVSGVWIKKYCASTIKNDLVVMFIPDFSIFGTSPHYYTEYLMTLHGLLLLQGFDNPAIFVPKIPLLSDESKFPAQLKSVIDSWGYVQETIGDSGAKVILAGDGMGANLALSYLLFRERGNFEENISQEKLARPFGAILISPILRVNQEKESSNIIGLDYLSEEFIKSIEDRYGSDDTSKNYYLFNPESCTDLELWKKAFPEAGVLLTWGSYELCHEETQDFGEMLDKCGPTKLWKADRKTHSWPFLSFLTEDAQDEKEDSCFVMSGILSRLTLWHLQEYLHPYTRNEPLNLLTIDDQHL